MDSMENPALLPWGDDFHGMFNDKFKSKIYTDWANHYLEKARNKKFITDLQHDVTDGVLLAEVIEAVTRQPAQEMP
nr:hypothetical protein BaRGS_007629 [Batillaria attramentaria]